MGRNLAQKTWQADLSNNQEEVMNLALGEILKDSERGLYFLELVGDENYRHGSYDEALVIRTDLGVVGDKMLAINTKSW